MRGRERKQRLPASKIVCTIGPASAERRVISALIREGMSVARLNFSHGTHAWHGEVIVRIREEAASLGRHVAVMQDLQGPKVRLGIFSGGKALLKRGSSFTLTTDRREGDASAASVDYKGFPGDVAPGDAVLLADGLVRLVVREVRGRNVLCRVVEGGEVGDRKGVNIPGREVSLPSLTRKDLRDLAFGLSRGVDFVALSFVRRGEDVRELKRRIRRAGKNTPVIAKLEKSQALQHLGEILEEADGVIVARGDLGVETAIEEVPVLQKRILREASRAGVVAITATQMLESMTRSRIPTRAEASDVANAVLDGSDAVMLSAETSVGVNPVETVKTMRRILSAAEYEKSIPAPDLHASCGIPGVVADAACRAAASLGANAIVVFSRSGSSARILSKFLPETPIIAFTPERSSARRMALYRGVEPGVVKKSTSSERMVEGALREMRKTGQVSRGDRLVIVYGSPTGHCDQMRVVSL
jgi:pyruvate kinase